MPPVVVGKMGTRYTSTPTKLSVHSSASPSSRRTWPTCSLGSHQVGRRNENGLRLRPLALCVRRCMHLHSVPSRQVLVGCAVSYDPEDSAWTVALIALVAFAAWFYSLLGKH
jgi:MYXO-CTERM domain-containing protein